MDDRQPLTAPFLISIFDIDGYVRISESIGPRDTFELINRLHLLTQDTIRPAEPAAVKNIGDGTLMFFGIESIDLKVRLLAVLKDKIDALLQSQGFDAAVHVAAHTGTATVGTLGRKPFDTVTGFGPDVNRVFSLYVHELQGKFIISPELFDLLNSELQCEFTRYLPANVYCFG